MNSYENMGRDVDTVTYSPNLLFLTIEKSHIEPENLVDLLKCVSCFYVVLI